ncbi:hypothetical protein PR048_003927 [Dryococelus australis]|uniref:MADF domain-containing protein n=1 Tax=Dryococelus australis TaxID=614101 RepID=A0ABQ9IPT5_9NEOP|nr:hypothetical protein PR048_003927 [Dryococelus australis]
MALCNSRRYRNEAKGKLHWNSQEANSIRDEFMEYFKLDEDRVPWEDRICRIYPHTAVSRETLFDRQIFEACVNVVSLIGSDISYPTLLHTTCCKSVTSVGFCLKIAVRKQSEEGCSRERRV